MKYGAYSLLWTSKFTDKDLYLFDKLKKMGFDGLEIDLSSVSTRLIPKIKERMNQTGMECTCALDLGKDQNLLDQDERKRKNGIECIKKAIEIASELSSDVLGGVLYAAWGEFTGEMRTPEEWNNCKGSLLEVADFAKERGVVLALEPVNRYETYFLSTAEDARKLVVEINHPNIKILLDTYHLNIEEDSFYEAIKTAGKYLYHVHFCENNRGIPGTGHIQWAEVFKALKEIGYNRWGVIESFVPAIDEIARMTAIWRKVAPSADAIAEQGLKFIKKCESDWFSSELVT